MSGRPIEVDRAPPGRAADATQSPASALAAEIKALVAAGERDAARDRFGALVALLQRRGLRIAYHYLRDAADADEAVQDAFVKVFLHIEQYREDLSFDVWFMRILVNACLDRLKSRTRQQRWIASPSEEAHDARPVEQAAGTRAVDRASAAGARAVAAGARGGGDAAGSAAAGVHAVAHRRADGGRNQRGDGDESGDGARAPVPGHSEAASDCWENRDERSRSPCAARSADGAGAGRPRARGATADRQALASRGAVRALRRDARRASRAEADALRDAAWREADAAFDDAHARRSSGREFSTAWRTSGQAARVLRFPGRDPRQRRCRSPAAAAAGSAWPPPPASSSAWCRTVASLRAVGRRRRIARLASRCRHRGAAADRSSCRRQPPTPRSSDDELLDEIEAAMQLRRAQSLRALDALTPTRRRAPRAVADALTRCRRSSFRKGLDLKHEVAGVLAESYHSALVQQIKDNDYRLRAGRLTVHLAREFGFCYGVDRAVDYAYQARRRFPDAPRLPHRRDHPQPARQRSAARAGHPLPERSRRGSRRPRPRDDVVILPGVRRHRRGAAAARRPSGARWSTPRAAPC